MYIYIYIYMYKYIHYNDDDDYHDHYFLVYYRIMMVDYDDKVCPEGRCSWIMPRCRRLVPTVGKVPDFAFWPTA